MIYVTSDLHGYPLEKFMALLDSVRFGNDDFLFILGDVIDRNGDGGVSLLRWIMLQPNVELLLGNHEAMMLDCAFLFEEITDDSLNRLTAGRMDALARWLANGAEATLASLRRLNARDPDAIADIFAFLRDAPLWDTVPTEDRDFILTHAGLGNFSPGKRLSRYDDRELLWHRPSKDERYHDHIITVFGHTPTALYGTPGRAFRTDTWIDVDTGAAGGGSPMLLRLDDMREFYAD